MNNISHINTESNLGKDIQSYMLEKIDILNEYNNKINQLGNVILDSKNYNNVYEINIIIDNLNQLGKITSDYVNKMDLLNKKYSNLSDLINSPSGIEANKLTSEFVESEKEFINYSINTYNYLLENQNQIEIYESGEVGIFDDTIRNTFNDLVDKMNNKLIIYQNKTNELEKFREKSINKLNNQ